MLTSKGIGNLFKVFLLVGLSFLFLTCDPGLGKAVDTQAPTVAVTFPITKTVIKGEFIMTGIASDEVKVAGCTVSFKNMATSEEYEYVATVSNGEFTVTINSEKEDGTYEIPDGDYNVTVTAVDAYHAASADVVYTIDNTAPTVLLTSPNSYSVSNWPNMYKTFNIKGEVYDRSNLESVTVYLVDEEGEILKSVIADGTNTFLASFDEPFDEEKVCYYYAIAKDAGGNENSYCYHKSDIFQLLSGIKNNQTVESETSIVFPSINTIGYVDQGQSTNLTEMLSREDLVGKKIENNGAKKVDGKIVFPGFNYYKDNAAQIKWLNISNEVSKVAGIAIGSPVLGTIMPPTDGSAINYSSVNVWVSKVPNDFKAAEEFNTPEEYKSYLNSTLFVETNKLETCVISEGESGDKQVKLTAVGESLNFQVDSSKPGEDNNWPSGFYYVKVEFTTESGVTNYDYCKFEVTSGAPVLTEGNFAQGKEKASYYRGYVTSNTIEEGLAGKALTSDENSPVEIEWSYIGTTVSGEEVKSEGNRVNPSSEGIYAIDIKHAQDGEYTYTLTAAPDSELSTVISRVVVVDTTKPSIEFSTLTNDEIIESSEFSLKGNIEDANGIEKVEYQLLAGNSQVLIDGSQGTGWQEIPKAKSSFNLTLTNLKENVSYTIKIRATDVAGNISGDEQYKCNFTIDLANPVAKIEEPKPEANSSIVFVNKKPTFTGKASDNAVTEGKVAKSASLSFTKDGGSVVQVPSGTGAGQFNWSQNTGTWTWIPTESQFTGTGKYDVTLKVTDNAGKSTSETRTVSLDTNVPTIKLTQVNPYVDREKAEDGYYVNGEITVKFDITENDYIKEIKWYKPDGSVDSQDLGTNAQPTVKISTTAFADGTKLGEFKLVVTDRSGNEGVYTGAELTKYEINQSSDNPMIELSGINPEIITEEGISANNNLFSTLDSISLTFKDDDGVSSGTYQIDENAETTINGGNAKVKTETISLNGLDQGAHTIKVTVTDSNGKSVSSGTIYFGIDDKAPELNIDGYTDKDIDAGFKNANFNITGSVSDTYELRDLVYSYSDTPDVKTKIRDGNGNWNLSITKPNSSEKKTITFVASDKFLRTTVKTFTYTFDLDKPNLVILEEQKTAITDKYFNQNSMVTLNGTANDISGDASPQSGLKLVQYGLGEGHNATTADTLAYQNANGSSEWTVLLDIPTFSDGAYTLFVKAVDNSGNESDIQKFNITADSTSPILSVGGSTDASGTSYASEDLNLTGTVSDANFEKLTYTYTLNGAEKESDALATTGSGSERTWSIKKRISDLGDGTHVFKVVATDKAGNQTSLTRNIIVDKTAPEITTNVSPQIMYNNGNGEELTVNGTISVNVRVTETNKLKGVYYTEKDESTLASGGDWSSETSFNETELAAGKTISIDTTKYTDKTKLPLRIKAIDEAGNYKVVKVNPVVNQASDKPTFTPSNIKELGSESLAGWIAGNPSNVFGDTNSNMIFTLSDDDSVKEYWVKVDSDDFVKVSDVNSTQQIVTYSVKELSYDRHTITFRVIDSNCKDDLSTKNNYVEQTYYIAIDDKAPEFTLNNKNGQYVGSSFDITGTVEDANGIDKIVFQPKTGGEQVYYTIDCNDTEITKSFSYTFEVPQTKDTIVITAYDSIGNATIKELTYLVDSTSPVLLISTGENSFVDGDSPSLRITGTATDGDKGSNDNGISGIDQVRLKIGSPITGVDDDDSYLASGKIVNGEMSWSFNLDFTGKPAGSYTVYAKAFDIAGNESAEDTIIVYVDTDVPQLNDSYTGNFVGVYKGDFVIEGTATDASGVKSVTAKIQGASGNLTGSFTETSDNSPSNWSFTIPANTGDGQLTILVTAKDGCGKTVQETFTATLDTVVPSVTFTDISDDDGNIETIETSKTTDKPRVSVTYADSTSGVNKIDYAFYYYDPEGNITGQTTDSKGFVNYSKVEGNAAGSFTKDKSFSGTVVMRMAESTGSTGAFINSASETDGKWYVKVTVTDEAGNVATYDSPYFYVDQHKPTLEVTKPSDGTLKKQYDSLIVSGTTSDSLGGKIDRVVVKVTHPNYNDSQLEEFTKTFTKDGSNGTKLTNISGENYSFEYTWNQANSPFIYFNEYEVSIITYDVAGNETSVKKKVYCDNEAPSISFTRPYSYSVDSYGKITKGTVVNSPIGDTSIKAVANDPNMSSLYYQVGGTVAIESTGTLGTKDYKITKLTITDGGVGSDTYGTSVTDVKFDDVTVSLAGTWNKVSDANLNFDVSYNTLTFNNNEKTYHFDGDGKIPADKSTIMTLDVHFVAVDSAGNINYCKMPIKVDTDTDKPNLLVLSPKTVNDVANVGGTATVSGTVNDDNSVHSVWMQVELANKDEDTELANYVNNILTSSDGSKTFGIDYSNGSTYNMSNSQVLVENNNGTYSLEDSTSYFTDRTKWYRVNLGAPNSTSTTWNMVLNKFKEFDNTSLYENGFLKAKVAQTELIVRVRALDTKSGNDNISADAKLGDVTEFRLVIDAGSPSIIINNIEDFPAEGSYIGGTLKFDVDFSDDESITEYSIIAYSSASGDNRSYTIIGDSNPNGFGPNVPVKGISVDTQNIYNACGNLIQIKFFAKDKSKDTGGEQIAAKESYITFKYTIDNSAPEANNIATIDGINYRINTESVEGDTTGALREPEGRGNHLRILSNQAAFIGKVADEVNGSGVDYVMLYFTKEGNLYNPSKKNTSTPLSYKVNLRDENGGGKNVDFPVASINDIARTPSSNGGKVTPYIVIDRAEGMIDSGANGDLDGYDENLKANGDWVVYIESSNLPDGVYDIHYVVVDFAKNARYYHDTMLVQNNAPKITSIVLATDINGDGTVDISADGTSDEDKKFDTSMGFKNTGFNVRNSKLKIKVNVEGGKEPLKYFLRYQTTGDDGVITTDENNPGYYTGEFEVTSFLGDSGTPVDYVVWVEDSVESGLSLSSGETVIDMIMDNVDEVKPVAQFFELNTTVESSSVSNSNRGSLFKDKDNKIQGHIEPRQYSPVDNTSLKDPDVSGTIILRGEALDNQRIASIVLKLNETNVTIAEWDSETKQLLGKNNAVIVDDLGLNGHYVEWSYAWDTNAIIKYDVPVVVSVKDSKGNTNATTVFASGTNDNKPRTNGDGGTVDNRFTSDGWGYNSMTVDAVPYITAVVRNTSYNTNRAKSGAIPMLRGQDENCIEGFNLGSDVSKIKVVITETKDGSTGYTHTMDRLKKSGTSTAFRVLDVARDGYLSTVVNEIRSINNINDNSQEYNREGNEYDTKTTYWTDDRYVRVWQNYDNDYFPGSDIPIYPSMAIGSNGDLYASFSNYSNASVYYSMRNGSETQIFSIYDPPEETDICVTTTDNGTDKVNVLYSGNYDNGNKFSEGSHSDYSGGLYVYDTSAPKIRSDKWRFVKHEMFYHNKMLQQFKNMRIKRKNTDNTSYVHIAYFDRLTSSIHYSNSPANGKYNGNAQEAKSKDYSWVNIDGTWDSDDNNVSMYDGKSIYLEDNATIFEDVGRCTGTGESLGLALTKSGYPVIVYYDASNKVIKLARGLAENPKGNINNWRVQKVSDNSTYLGVSVESITCEIDSSGNIHIAFQNGKNQLVYIKSTTASADGKTKYTFTEPVVVAEGVSWVDLTLFGSTPYISYLSGANSYDGLNLAFLDKNIDTNFDGSGDGAWETMVAPLAFKATSIRTCVEVHPKMTTSGIGWEAAIGFTPGDKYRYALYIGSGAGH